MITAQNVFGTVAAHLLQQDGPSIVSLDGGCMYRAPDGRKCAVGVLIPDEYYSQNLEWHSVNTRDVLNALPVEYHSHQDLLSYLQEAHDNAAEFLHDVGQTSAPDWKAAIRSRLENVASRFQLNDQMLAA